MLKKYPIIKWSLIVFVSTILIVISFGFWFMNLLPSIDSRSELKNTLPKNLSYLSNSVKPARGKILAVVTSCDIMGSSNKKTGFELTELSRAYYVFQANGFEVDIASPLGGNPPVVIDGDDMGAFDYAFLNDTSAQYKVEHSIVIEQVNADDYQAIYFVGGKGAVWDFPNNTKIQSLVSEYYQSGKVIGAVCHGPAALVNVTLDDGSSLLANKTVSGFTNNEELFLIPDAKTIFPFLLQDKLVEKGAQFSAGGMYLENISHDGNLITGQNPWSTWALAETMIKQLGYNPIEREITAEENTINILSIYENKGYDKAKTEMEAMMYQQNDSIDRILLAMHSIVAGMQWDIGKVVDLLGLVSHAKSLSTDHQ
jgi:putative intracellular protease/amidase